MANWGEIKNRIVLEGEAGYKKAMAEINRALREARSEMKAVAAEYDASGGSAQALTANIAALENVHEGQTLALETMRAQLDKVAEKYGENSREATELRTRINNARAEMAKTANELTQLRTRLDTTADAMDDAAGGTQSTAKGLSDIGETAERAADDVGGLGKALSGLDLGDLAGKALGGLTIGAVGKGIGTALTLSDEQVQAWNQMAAYTGATGEALEGMKDAAETVYKGGSGESLGDVAGAVAAIYQLTGETDKGLESCTTTALSLRDTFNMDVSQSAMAAAVLMQEFGVSAEDAYNLIAYGAQNGADKNGNLLDTINEYSPYFADSGKDADTFFKALTDGAKSGVYDVDKIGDAWKEFMLRLTSDDQGAKDALGELGFAAEDVTRKIAHGGDAADLATSEIIAALARTEDPYERNRLGIALFGTQWEDVSGKVLPIFASMGEGLDDVTGSADALNESNLMNFEAQFEGATRRVTQRVGELAKPFSEAGTQSVKAFNDAWDNGKGLFGSFGSAYVEWGRQLHTIIDPVFEDVFDGSVVTAKNAGTMAGEAWGEGFAQKTLEIAADPETTIVTDPKEIGIDDLYTAHSEAVGSGDTTIAEQLSSQIDAAASAAVQKAKNGEQTLTIDDLFAARAQAAGEGNEQLVAELDAQIEAVIASTKSQAEKGGEVVADAGIGAIEDAEPDAESAGDSLGEAGVDGLTDGSAGMYGAGENAAQGAVQGALSQMDAMYRAGASLGGGFRSGFQQKLMIHSPSRAAMEDMAYVTEGYLQQIERDKARLREAAAAMAELVREPMRGGTDADGYGMRGSASGISADELAQAMREAISGMAVMMDGERVGVLGEPYSSRETARRAMGTVRGVSSAAKSW